jgi:TatD DNase family protein
LKKILDSHSHTENSNGVKACIFGINEIPDQYFTIGIHPCYPAKFDAFYEMISKLLENPFFIGIGEIGFDNSALLSHSEQYELFEKQAELAFNINKPCIVHLVGLNEFFYKFLKTKSQKPQFLIHGFNKHIQVLEQFLIQNLFVSINHQLMKRDNFLAYFEKLWPNNLFIETDNYSIEIETIINQMSLITGINEDILTQTIWKNNQLFYHLKT